MDFSVIRGQAEAYKKVLDAKKAEIAPQDFKWYPYDTLLHFYTLDRLLTGENRTLFDRLPNKTVADIGGADGDMSFFFETLGYTMQFIDYAPTNYYGMQGVRTLKKALSSSVSIHEMDLDSQFQLPEKDYSLVFFLNILYHLKNPYYALETLAKSVSYCFLSTYVAQWAPDKTTYIGHLPLAYLLYPAEANNDASNYWVFTNTGLRRLCERTGWDICDYLTYGNTATSDPTGTDGDERAVCLLKSRLHQG